MSNKTRVRHTATTLAELSDWMEEIAEAVADFRSVLDSLACALDRWAEYEEAEQPSEDANG